MGIGWLEPVLNAKGFGNLATIGGVVALPAFTHVMEQGSEIENLFLMNLMNQPGGNRKAFTHVAIAEMSQQANHTEGMFIHRIFVQEVVLHHANNATKRRNITPENAIPHHARQLANHA